MLSERELRKLQDLLRRNADLDYISVEREILQELVDHYANQPPAPPNADVRPAPTVTAKRFINETSGHSGKKKTDD